MDGCDVSGYRSGFSLKKFPWAVNSMVYRNK